GTWEIYLDGVRIALSCNPNDWSVEPDYSVYGGLNICAPSGAPVSHQYEVRYVDGQTQSHSGFFAVVPAQSLLSAPVLRPLQIRPGLSAATLTAELDAPAMGNGAFVSLNCPALTNVAL